MSKWVDILKKNEKEFETNIKKNYSETMECSESTEDHNLKDVDDEFENEFSLIIHNIMFDFKKYIKNEQLPFMNKTNMTSKYLVNDFFKLFSTNYIDVKNRVDKDNEEYLKDLEEEENELYEENSDYDYR